MDDKDKQQPERESEETKEQPEPIVIGVRPATLDGKTKS